jgi:hypothetical protein
MCSDLAADVQPFPTLMCATRCELAPGQVTSREGALIMLLRIPLLQWEMSFDSSFQCNAISSGGVANTGTG